MSGQEATGEVDVLVLVTSAGGLDALSAVLANLPTDLDVAVLVQQHLSGQGSQLVAILGRRCAWPVRWARDGEDLRRGEVLVAPPGCRLEALPDRTVAVSAARRGAQGRPHDLLLTSVADVFAERAFAVVLTGMGRDGAVGTAAVLAAGGRVVAQSEESAEQPSMPMAAVQAGANLVLPLHDIAGTVADVVRGGPLPVSRDEAEAVRATFGDGGPVGELARCIDWTTSSLGPVSRWPQALRTAVRLAMDSPHPVGVYVGDDLILIPNEAAFPTLGGGREAAVLGRPLRDSFPDYLEYVREVLLEVRAGRTVRQAGAHLPFDRNGRVEDAWFDLAWIPVRDERGTVVAALEEFHERTEEVLSGRRLRVLHALGTTPAAPSRQEELEAQLEVLGASPDVPFAAAYVVDSSGTRASLAGVVGAGAGDALAPYEVRLSVGAAWPLQQVVDHDAPVVLDDLDGRFRGHHVGQEPLSLRTAHLHPLRDAADSRVVGVLVLGIRPTLPFDDRYRDFAALVGDTVGTRLAESQARERERERLERLAGLDRAKSEFFANVSHEFRTPLTLLLGPLDELRRRSDELPEPLGHDVALAQRNARRLLRMVESLLDFSRADAGAVEPKLRPVDLAGVTGEVASMFASLAASLGLTLEVDLPPLREPVWVDPEMWERIVSNLVSNALKFTWEGEVRLTLRPLARHAELQVSDTGVGIPQHEQPLVFQRFHRVQGSVGRSLEGAGIGLALVDELVRRHHGRLRLASEPGRGSTFTVWVPFGPRGPARPDDPPRSTYEVAAGLVEEARQWEPRGAPGTAGPVRAPRTARAVSARVLVVDDNGDMRDYLARLLGEHWDVEVAGDGREAAVLLAEGSFDLVVTDVMMPGLDGLELLRHLRSEERTRALPVVLLTARAGEDDAVRGLLAGADDYLLKPFTAQELLARVGARLELARAGVGASDAFLLAVADALVDLHDPDAVLRCAAEMLAAHLRVERVLAAARTVRGHIVLQVERGVHGTPEPAAGPVEVAALVEALEAGTTGSCPDGADEADEADGCLTVDDLLAAPGLGPHARRAWLDLAVRGLVVVPRRTDGAVDALLAVGTGRPRSWTAAEVRLVSAVARRAWAAVDRSRVPPSHAGAASGRDGSVRSRGSGRD